MEKRMGIVGVFLQGTASSAKINSLLSAHAGIILARMGLPVQGCELHVISLIVCGNTDELGSLTGKLGRLEGVQVKSMLTAAGVRHDHHTDKFSEPSENQRSIT